MAQVTVIMTVYNTEDYVEESINSILTQTYRDFEFIIVNDGSTDGTAQILNSIQDSRVQIMHLEENLGSATRLNEAVEQSSGLWIAVQDADDLSLPTRLETQLNYIQQKPQTVAVGSLIESFPGNKQVPNPKLVQTDTYFNSYLDKEDIKAHRFRYCPICHGSSLFSRQAFLEVGGYNPKYKIVYDYDLWLRMFDKGKIEKLPEVLYRYRIHGNSLSQKDWRNTLIEINMMAIAYIREYEFPSLDYNPRVIVSGHPDKCHFFKEYIQPESKLAIQHYVSKWNQADLEYVFQLLQAGKIEAIIFVNYHQFKKPISYLLGKGLILNKNLFCL